MAIISPKNMIMGLILYTICSILSKFLQYLTILKYIKNNTRNFSKNLFDKLKIKNHEVPICYAYAQCFLSSFILSGRTSI